MAEEIKKVELYSAEIANKLGEGAKALSQLKEAGVSFVAIWGYPMGKKRARVDMIPSDGALFKKAAKKAGLEVKKMTAFLVQGEDHPGALADAMTKLADAGINVYATQAVCSGSGLYGGVVQVEPEDVRKAAKALGAK